MEVRSIKDKATAHTRSNRDSTQRERILPTGNLLIYLRVEENRRTREVVYKIHKEIYYRIGSNLKKIQFGNTVKTTIISFIRDGRDQL